jgi:hypothetical protein
MKSQAYLFTDSQMALFGVKTPTARRGKLFDLTGIGYFYRSPRKSMYAVVTQAAGQFVKRIFTLPLIGLSGEPRTGMMEVSVQADAKDRHGYGFATIYLNDGNGRSLVLTENAQTLRSMAQMLNAAANSTGAVWRK